MSNLSRKLMMGAAGAAGEKVYVEDVFSTYLYTGNGSTQTITNDIDLAGEGGLVWLKRRDSAQDHGLFDTTRGATKYIQSNGTDTETTNATSLTNFNSDGFTLGSFFVFNNDPSRTYASWTFRKAPRFFDVVTYTGDGEVGQTITHNLGVAPELIITKPRNFSDGWGVYAAPLGATKRLRLDLANAESTTATYWNNTDPTSFVFTVGTDNSTNGNTYNYIAYLFATCPGISKVGNYTGTGTTLNIDCGFTAGARFVLIKRADSLSPGRFNRRGIHNHWCRFREYECATVLAAMA